jgi:hypothetical protein
MGTRGSGSTAGGMIDEPIAPQDMPAHEAAARALEQFGFALKLSVLVENGTLRADMLPRTVLLPLEGGRIEVSGDTTPEMLKTFMANAAMGAISHSAVVMNRALEDTFGHQHPLDPQGSGGVRRRPEDLGDREAAQEIIYMFRSAVAHDPFRPKWLCKGARAGVFRVAQLGITFDATRLDGTPLDVRAIGGLDSYFRLLQYCERKIRRHHGLPDAEFAHQREWVKEIDLGTLVPPNAIAVRLSFHLEPGDGKAVLYSTRNDHQPVWLSGPSGEVTMRIVEPQRLYFETIGRDTRLELNVRGYQNPNGGS